MALVLKNGAVFLHIPKTGGTWVEEVLNACGLVQAKIGHTHADYDRIVNFEWLRDPRRQIWHSWKRSVLKLLGRYRQRPVYRFCFVRHPLVWYESWWKYMKPRRWNNWGREDDPTDWHPNATLNGLGDDDFNTFVRNVIQRRPGYVTELYYSYAKPGINFIGRTETLVDDLIAVLKGQGLKFDEDLVRSFPKANVSPTSAAEIDWDPQLRETVTQLELPALLHFGYLSSIEHSRLKLYEPRQHHQALRQRALPTRPIRATTVQPIAY